MAASSRKVRYLLAKHHFLVQLTQVQYVRRHIADPGPAPAEKTGPPRLAAGRYHLYVCLGCPFACRCLAVLYMKVRCG